MVQSEIGDFTWRSSPVVRELGKANSYWHWPKGRWPKQGIKGLRKEVYTDAALNKLLELAKEAKSKAKSGSIEAKRLQLFIDRFVKTVFQKFNFKRSEAEKL